MKKRIALLAALCLLMSLLAGCSAGGTDNGIPAAAFSSGNVLTLPIKATLNEGDYVSYGGHQFTSTKALSKMADLITKNNETVTAASYTNAHGDCWLFSKQTTTGTDYWCLYQSDPGGAKNQYIFSGMHRILTLSAGEGDLDLLMPLHLISDSYIRDNMGSRLTLDKEYSCGVQEADSTVAELFRAFYQSAGLYRIAASGDGFTLALNDVSSQLLLQFSFSEHDDSGWFTITDVTVHEPEPVDELSVVWTQDAETAPVEKTISGGDATQLSALLIAFDYTAGATDVVYPYRVDLGENQYSIRLVWKDNAWSGTAEYNGKTSALNTRTASIVAALLGVNGLMPLQEGSDELTDAPLIDCMATTNDVNVRATPSTSGKILVTLPSSSPVAVVGKTDNWYQILFNDQLAYMSADYLRAVNE